MLKAELRDRRSPSGNASPTSTERVARWRARKRRGVLFVADLEIFDRDLRLLKRGGFLTSDEPETLDKAEVENALGELLDAVAKRLGLFNAPSTPASEGS